jgi:hypothetical protein
MIELLPHGLCCVANLVHAKDGITYGLELQDHSLACCPSNASASWVPPASQGLNADHAVTHCQVIISRLHDTWSCNLLLLMIKTIKKLIKTNSHFIPACCCLQLVCSQPCIHVQDCVPGSLLDHGED